MGDVYDEWEPPDRFKRVRKKKSEPAPEAEPELETEVGSLSGLKGDGGLTGSISSAGSTMSSGTHATFPPGGVITSGPSGAIFTGSGITISGGSITRSGSITTTKPVPGKTLDLPTKKPRKILVAFLGADDEVEWCGKVFPDDINVDMSNSEPVPRMTLSFWMNDAG